MKIDVSKIEGYSEMSAEEKVKALEAFETEVDETKWKELVNKASAEASKYKKELREKQTEEERREAERKEELAKKEEELALYKRASIINDHKANFLGVGYPEALATESAEAIADGDFTKVFANLGNFLSEKEKTIKEDLLKSTPKPQGGFTNPEVTKEQFDKMSYTEKVKLYETNKELYESLKGE